MSIAIIIPVFDRFNFLPPLLNQLAQQTVLPTTVIIVDHGHNSLTLETSWPFSVEVIKRDSSLWFAAATNEGLRYARIANHEFLMILNDDVELGSDLWLESLFEIVSGNEMMVASAAVDHSLRVRYAGVRLKAAAFRYEPCDRGRSYEAIDKSPVHCDVLPTRGLLFPTRLLGRIGYLNDQTLPHHSSDYEWTSRAKKIGIELVMARDVYVITDRESMPDHAETNLRVELAAFFKNPYLKGSFPIARAYASSVFKQPYRSAFLAAHCARFLFRCVRRRFFKLAAI